MRPFTVLILPADMFSVASLRQCVERVHPTANFLLAASVRQARFILHSESVDLFLTELDVPDGDVLDLLNQCAQPPSRVVRTLVLTGRNAPRLLISLRSLKIDGVFDSITESSEQFERALRALDAGRLAWSDVFLAGLHSAEARIVLHQLTPREQLGLATMGDGRGDRSAAECLGMTLSSVRSMRQDIYAKLGAHDTEDIVRLAAQLGYTRFSSRGLTTLGLSVLVREYQTQSKRPTPLPTALLASCGLSPAVAEPCKIPLAQKQA